jgi:hypothetical protein
MTKPGHFALYIFLFSGGQETSNNFSRKRATIVIAASVLQYSIGDCTGIGSGCCEWRRKVLIRDKVNRHCRAHGCLNLLCVSASKTPHTLVEVNGEELIAFLCMKPCRV